MQLLLHTYLFMIGLVFGSFYNVVGLRVPRGKSIVKPRSHCVTCQRNLSAVDLFPVISFLFLRGKCRGCGEKISILYPTVELLTGVLFALAPLFLGWTLELFVGLALISLFMIILVSDISYMLIPDKILLYFAPLFLILRILVPLDPWWDMLLGAVVGFGLLLLIAIISKGGMGGGDIKLFALLGLILGFKDVLIAFFLSTLFGAVIGLFLLIVGKVKRGKPMPFGPYIALGTLTAYFYGEQLWEWYIRLM